MKGSQVKQRDIYDSLSPHPNRGLPDDGGNHESVMVHGLIPPFMQVPHVHHLRLRVCRTPSPQPTGTGLHTRVLQLEHDILAGNNHVAAHVRESIFRHSTHWP